MITVERAHNWIDGAMAQMLEFLGETMVPSPRKENVMSELARIRHLVHHSFDIHGVMTQPDSAPVEATAEEVAGPNPVSVAPEEDGGDSASEG